MQDCETKTFIVPNHLNFLIDAKHFNSILDRSQGFVERVLMDDQCFEHLFLDHDSVCFINQNASWILCEALPKYRMCFCCAQTDSEKKQKTLL